MKFPSRALRAVAVLAAVVCVLPLAQAQQQYGNQHVVTSSGSPTLVTMTAQGAGTQDSPDLGNVYGRGVIVFMNISAVTGTVSVVLEIQGKDAVSGAYYAICTGTARTGTGLYTLQVYPAATPSAGAICNAILPANWRVEVRHGAGSTPATTGTVSADLIN